VFVFAEDEDNVQLVITESSSSKKCESLLVDDNSRSPVLLASDGAAATGCLPVADNTDTGHQQHSVQGCCCVESTSALSPTHVADCLLNSVTASNVHVRLINKHNVSKVSDLTQGLFMVLA